MAKILLIESTTEVCSVAIAVDKKIVAQRENVSGRTHASELAVFIDECIGEWSDDIQSLHAVAVSMGPGSYTGLRIGVSTAKGICYALQIPLIAIPTLKSLASGFLAERNDVDGLICPMIDARRMEVYQTIFNTQLDEMVPVAPKIIDENSYADELIKQPVYFLGNGVPKASGVIHHSNAVFCPDHILSARFMSPLAEAAYLQEQFEDMAYFEPFYLKEFVTTTPKNNVLKGLIQQAKK